MGVVEAVGKWGVVASIRGIMQTSLNWLNALLDRGVTVEQAQRWLTGNGFPVEMYEQVQTRAGREGGDVRLDVEVTSNRSDCLSHIGLAREVAAGSSAAGDARRLVEPTIEEPKEEGEAVESLASLQHEETAWCPLYTARVITGVKIGPSPDWLVARLEAVGLRSVNNVVDVTNYVLLEEGQPLHAFDLNRLAGRQIVVRRAREKEGFTAIDGSRHELSPGVLVIADEDRAVAVAGVMGGAESEVGEGTTDILLESAMFDPLAVRRAARRLKLSSDSSYRFERGVDPAGVERASRRAAGLILELAGGRLAKGVLRSGEVDDQPRRVTMRVARCNAVLGLELSAPRMVELLSLLGLTPTIEQGDAGEVVACIVPTCRLDLHREVDLIEEVARLHGLDAVEVLGKLEIDARGPQPRVEARRLLGRVLAAHGYHEAITPSFLSGKAAGAMAGGEGTVSLVDDRRKAEPVLRPGPLPSLLACRKANADAGNEGVALFEAASGWSAGDGGEVVERRRLALLQDVAEDAQGAVRALRSTVGELAEALGGSAAGRVTVEPVEDERFDAAGRVLVGDRELGILGIIAAKVRDAFEVQASVAGADLDLEALLGLYPPRRGGGALAKFPPIERDLSVIVDEGVAWRELESTTLATRPERLESLVFLGTYRGKPIERGKKSVSFRLRFRDAQRTLRHEEVDPQVAAVVQALEREAGAELRAG